MGNKRLIIRTRQAVACWVIFLLLGSCGPAKKVPANNMQAIRLTVQFLSMNEENQPVTITDSLFLAYYRDFIVYRIPVRHTETAEHVDAEGELISQVIKGTWMTYRYFIFRRTDTTGYLYDTLAAGRGKPESVQEFRRRRLLVKEENSYRPGDSLLQRFNTEDGGMVEVYHRKVKETPWNEDTCRFKYSKDPFTGVDFSLHHLLDSLRKMRVVEVSVISNPDPTNSELYFRLRREGFIRMERVSLPDSLQLREFLDKLN